MNNSYFGAIHYEIHLRMKLDYIKSRIFHGKSLSKLETLHPLCELERTHILQNLALAVLKIPYAGYLLSGNRSNFIDYEGNILVPGFSDIYGQDYSGYFKDIQITFI